MVMENHNMLNHFTFIALKGVQLWQFLSHIFPARKGTCADNTSFLFLLIVLGLHFLQLQFSVCCCHSNAGGLIVWYQSKHWKVGDCPPNQFLLLNSQNIVMLYHFGGNSQNIARFHYFWGNSQNIARFHNWWGNSQIIARFQFFLGNSQNNAWFYNCLGNSQIPLFFWETTRILIVRVHNFWGNNQNIARFYDFWGLDDCACVALALYCNVFTVKHSFIVFRIFNNKQSGSMKLWGEMVVITKMCAVKNPNIQNVL